MVNISRNFVVSSSITLLIYNLMFLKIFVFVEGVNAQQFESTYGIQTDGSGSLDLRFVTHGEYSDNVGSRVYLTDPSGDKYYMFRYCSPLLPWNTST